MPQDPLFSNGRRVTGLEIHWKEAVKTDGRGWNAEIRLVTEEGGPATVYVECFEGVMLDMAALLSEDVTSAFFFGEERDVQRAAFSVGKVARAHRRRHQRLH